MVNGLLELTNRVSLVLQKNNISNSSAKPYFHGMFIMVNLTIIRILLTLRDFYFRIPLSLLALCMCTCLRFSIV